MSTPKWDKGPWIAIPASIRFGRLHDERPLFDDGLWAILPESNMERLPICTVDRGDDNYAPTREKAKHIAHLIAAAPDLYAALEECLRLGGASDDEWMPASTIAKVRAALAKARGESV